MVVLSPIPGSSVLDALRRNDPSIVRSLYTRHFPIIRQFVRKNNGTLRDAQDVFQEAMTILWLNVKEDRVKPDAQGDVGGYLYRVAKNKWLDTVRSAAHKHMRVVVDEESAPVVLEGPDETEGRLQRLRSIYAALDERCRAVLDRFYYERQDMATIAASLGVEEESVRTMKYRCMMKLRAQRRIIDGVDETDRSA